MKQDSKGEIQQDILLYCHGNPTLMKSRKTIKHLQEKKNQCYLPRELKKMHFKEELDISTIWWLFETKVWLQFLQAAELEHIVLDKLFSLFSS